LLPRPDLFAHREALRLPASKVVEKLVEIVGRKLTAYVGGVKDARAVDRWIAGGEIYGNAESRLRFHTVLLGADIPIVEHMCNLEKLPPSGFTFTATPVKVKGIGTFPVRAFATLGSA